jgi:hypothetical protein
MTIFHLTKMLSGGGGVYTTRLSEALRRSGVESRVLSLDDGSLVPPGGLGGKINSRFDWALSGMIHRRSCGTVLSVHHCKLTFLAQVSCEEFHIAFKKIMKYL